ncbi:MAG: glycosyltransferase family 39 protein [Chitinophagales bacterium]|nr:glycosyltransferase family 39 protein [Chitinophagales bacterium]
MKHINWVLISVLIVGIALRFFGFPEIPFTYDELSTWVRTDYSRFSDLINKGVRTDGHPALIQVFLNYWRLIFGDSEAAFKLPFLIMGVASIYMVYLIGKKWFSETTGILSAAFVAVLQYTVMYSAIARPYMSGMFFSLMMVWYWTNYFFGERKRLHLILYIFFSVLCFYNHYFSLMFAGIVGLSGFVFVKRKNVLEYAIALILIAALFLPHIGISQDQFSMGGVGSWLAKPDESFFATYLSYIFNFSILLQITVVLLVALSFAMRDKEWKPKNKFRVLALLWFVLPIVIGYWYSVNRNPVLQYSVLIFSFPFLLLFLFSFYANLKILYQAGLVIVVLAMGTYSLIVDRMHFKIFYNQPIERLVKNAIDFEKEHHGKKTLVILKEPSRYMAYYLKKWNSNIDIKSWNDLKIESYFQFEKYVASQNADYMLCGEIPYDQLVIARNHYPYIMKSEKGLNYSFFALSKDSAEQKIIDFDFNAHTSFDQPGSFWDYNPVYVKFDSATGKNYYQMDSTQEYGPNFKAELFDFMKDRNNIMMVSIHVSNVKPDPGIVMVINFGEDSQPVYYQDRSFNYFFDTTVTQGNLVYAFTVRDFPFTHNNTPVKIFIWNRSRQNFRIDEMKLTMIIGNPYIYGSIEPVPYSKF